VSFSRHGACPLLQVFDLPRALASCSDPLGFTIVQCAPPAEQVAADDFGWVRLRRGGTDLMLNTTHDLAVSRPLVADAAREAARGVPLSQVFLLALGGL